MSIMRIRDVSLHVEILGKGDPLVLLHGGPGADMYTMVPFRRCADRSTLIFYDHRCNGRSVGAPTESMTWDNLTADADALRDSLGFDRWAMLGHSFGGYVARRGAKRAIRMSAVTMPSPIIPDFRSRTLRRVSLHWPEGAPVSCCASAVDSRSSTVFLLTIPRPSYLTRMRGSR